MTIWDFAHHHTALAVFFALLAAAVLLISAAMVVALRVAQPARFSADDRAALNDGAARLRFAWHADAHKHPGNIEAAKKLESMATKTGQHDGYGLEKHAMWCRIGLEEARDVEPSDGRSS